MWKEVIACDVSPVAMFCSGDTTFKSYYWKAPTQYPRLLILNCSLEMCTILTPAHPYSHIVIMDSSWFLLYSVKLHIILQLKSRLPHYLMLAPHSIPLELLTPYCSVESEVHRPHSWGMGAAPGQRLIFSYTAKEHLGVHCRPAGVLPLYNLPYTGGLHCPLLA